MFYNNSKILIFNYVLVERGPAFDIMIKELIFHGAKPFIPEFHDIDTNFGVAHVLVALTILPLKFKKNVLCEFLYT